MQSNQATHGTHGTSAVGARAPVPGLTPGQQFAYAHGVGLFNLAFWLLVVFIGVSAWRRRKLRKLEDESMRSWINHPHNRLR